MGIDIMIVTLWLGAAIALVFWKYGATVFG
jgi:hypothetical protein